MKPDDKICYCYNVPYRKLWHFARRRRLARASQMSECLGAGTGCGWCVPILKRIHETAQATDDPAGQPSQEVAEELAPVVELTAEEYAAQRDAYIREKKPRHEF